jgi:hypothetical protein
MLLRKCKQGIEGVHGIQDLLALGFKGDDIECFLWSANVEEKKDFVQNLEKGGEIGMLPFMKAAILPQCELNVIYNLAMMRPDLCMREKVFQQL